MYVCRAVEAIFNVQAENGVAKSMGIDMEKATRKCKPLRKKVRDNWITGRFSHLDILFYTKLIPCGTYKSWIEKGFLPKDFFFINSMEISKLVLSHDHLLISYLLIAVVLILLLFFLTFAKRLSCRQMVLSTFLVEWMIEANIFSAKQLYMIWSESFFDNLQKNAHMSKNELKVLFETKKNKFSYHWNDFPAADKKKRIINQWRK